MPKTFATLKAEILSELQDVNSAVWDLSPNTTEIENKIEDALREVSDYSPRLVKYSFKLESRIGTTTSYLNTWLMDATKDQFVPTSDVDKVVHNITTTEPATWAASTAYTKGTRISPTTPNGRRYICSTAGTSSTSEPTWPTTIDGTVADGTVTWMHRGLVSDPAWAIVLSSGSNTGIQLNLSKDIMANDEEHELFNKGCWNSKQINLSDIADCVGLNHGVIAVEYPVGTRREFTIEGDILTILLDDDYDIPDSGDSDSDIEVLVWIKRKHQVTQQTITTMYIDLAAGYASGNTSIILDYDGGTITGTIKAGSDITLGSTRGTYITTADATFSANHITLSIFPGLESSVADDNVVRLLVSSLDTRLERLVVAIAAGKARMSKAGYFIGENYGGGVWAGHYKVGQEQYLMAIRELERGRPVVVKATYSRL